MNNTLTAQGYPSDAARFLEIIAGDSQITFQTFDDTDRKDPQLNRIFHSPDCLSELDALQKKSAGVFIMVNEGDGEGRRAENVKRVRAVFVDLDGSPIKPVMKYNPHLVIESSPGKYHAYWLVSDCTLEQFRPTQKALAAKFEGDPVVHDLPRVMRVPGFLHQKEGVCSEQK